MSIQSCEQVVETVLVKKRLDIFHSTDSLADRDMAEQLQEIQPLINELLKAESTLPDMKELSAQIRELQLTHRKYTKEVLRFTPAPVVDTSRPRDRDHGHSKPLYGLPKTEMPTFEGDPKLWRKFWERFNQRISMHDLPATEKIAQLEQAIKPPEGRALVNAAKGTEEEYLEFVKALQERYDQPKQIYRTYVQEAFEHSTPHTRTGLYALDAKLQDTMRGLELYGGLDAGSVIVAAVEKGLTRTTMAEWTALLETSWSQPWTISV